MPQVNNELKKHSLTLKKIIQDKIKSEGPISFAEYMQMALYYPTMGYYSSGMHKFGKEGDFITSPELGSLFAQCLAKQFQQIVSKLDRASILEIGAGTGQFCFDCLLTLDSNKNLPEHYYILEVSADLQQRQQTTVAKLPKHIRQRVRWLKQPLDEPFNGVIFANEVLDALAVEVFKYDGNNFKRMMLKTLDDNQPCWQDFPEKLNQELKDKKLNLSENYISEFIPNLSNWLKAITGSLQQGAVIFVDYGYERASYYHPQRNQGTLVCHFQHQANYNYFNNIGIQDMTAFVDFTALAEAADSTALSVDGYTTQAHFLMSLGIHESLGDSEENYKNYYKKTTEMKKLTLPNEMGEKFKVMALTKNLELELQGFSFSNQLHLL